MLKKLGGRRKFKHRLIILLSFIIILLLFLFIFENKLRPTVKAIAETKANLIATETINKAIYDDVLGSIEYNDLVNIHKDEQNKITLIQANTIQISRLISKTGLAIKERLDSLKNETFEIPLGQAIGSYLLAAHGPPIKVKILPVGEIDVELQQDFHEAGINQTRHMLYLDIQVTVKVVVPMATKKVSVNTKAPIAETIIVGSVPNTVVRLQGADNLLKGYLYNGLVSDK